jgi:hypothetical protein
MLKWSERICGNCAYWSTNTTGDDFRDCLRNPIVHGMTMQFARCGEHRTEDEVNEEIKERHMKTVGYDWVPGSVIRGSYSKP